MKHLTDAQLRAHLDGELPEAEAAAHLQACSACQSRMGTVSARSERVAATLKTLEPASQELPRSPEAALARFKDKQRKEQPSMIAVFSKRLRPAFAVAATLLAMGIALTFPPVQALATNFLGLFRVKQIEVVQIDPSRLSDLNNDKILGQRIGEMFSDSYTVSQEPSAPVVVADAQAASETAGFNVRLPANAEGSPTLSVQTGAAFSLTIDREQAQGILNDAGFSDLVLPESVDNATISVDIPASVAAAYGPCPALDAAEAEGEGMSWSELRQCIIFTQMPSPTVDAPADLDVKALAEVGLQFMGMSPEEARQLSETVDWSTTLVIPIPRNAAEVEDVTVDGVTGTLLSRRSDEDMPARYTLIWVKEGIIYAIAGFDRADDALAMANSLP